MPYTIELCLPHLLPLWGTLISSLRLDGRYMCRYLNANQYDSFLCVVRIYVPWLALDWTFGNILFEPIATTYISLEQHAAIMEHFYRLHMEVCQFYRLGSFHSIDTSGNHLSYLHNGQATWIYSSGTLLELELEIFWLHSLNSCRQP